MESLENEKKTNPATDTATYNLHNNSPMQSPGTGPFSPQFQKLQSPPGLFAPPGVNLDRQTSYPRWSQQPQLPSSELFPQALVRTSFSAPNTPQISTPSYDPARLNQMAYQTNPYDTSKFVSQYSNGDAAIPHKKSSSGRRQMMMTTASAAIARKTKCLKLYCECFSSGHYCAKTCNCQECYNTPDYEDTVQGSRELIEIRNPLAFAPKIGDGIGSIPSSEKYRRGCNCKKTMCQKKYCECFQSEVGCTNVCRCEGCENVYGKKGDYSETKDMLSKRSIRQTSGITFDNKLQKAATDGCFPQIRLNNPYNLSPLASQLQFPFLQSPASNLDFYSPNGKSPQFYQNFDNIPKISESINYSHGENVPNGSNLQNGDVSDLLLPEYGVSNSFDSINMFNGQANPIPSGNHLPFLDSQYTQIPPFGENINFRNDYDKHGLFERYTPPSEVKAIDFSPQGQVFSSPRSLRGARYVPLFPPLTPFLDTKGCNISEKKEDCEDSNCEKRR